MQAQLPWDTVICLQDNGKVIEEIMLNLGPYYDYKTPRAIVSSDASSTGIAAQFIKKESGKR